jgi:hypothetical protein
MTLTMEEAIGNLALFFFGSSAEKKSAIIGAIDPKAIMGRMDMKNIYMEIVDEWHIYSLDEKNQEFNALWDALGLESSLKNVMTEEELKGLIPSFYVVADVLLDFVAEDYHHTAQNILGTLVHNISNILQTHNHDINYAWIRSYDSFYSDIQYTCTHSYGEWRVVKEASTEDYGVRVKVCERCEEELYEAIPKLVPDVKFPASLFGEGSLIAVVFATITTVAVGVAVYFYVRMKKETESVQDDG